MAAGQVRNYITYATTLLTVRKSLFTASSSVALEAVLRLDFAKKNLQLRESLLASVGEGL